MSSESVREIPRAAWCGLATLLGLIAWLYAPVLGYDFVMFDDDVNIYSNPHIGQITWERVAWACTGFDYLPRVMPLAWLSLMAIFEVAGMDSAAFHAYNLALHLACVALVFVVAVQALCLASRSRNEARSPAWHAALALVAAAAWGLHPLRVESIAWATGWVYPQGTFFALLSAACFLCRHEASRPGWRRVWWSAALAAFACSVLTYPVALGLPAALLGFEAWLGRRPGLKVPAWRALAGAHAAFWAVAALVLVVNVWARIVRNQFYPAAPGLAEFTLSERLAQAACALPYYAVRPAWSGETTPVLDFRAPASVTAWPANVLALGLLLGGAWALWRWKRAPGWACAGFAFLGVAGPFSGLLDRSFQASDRYGYLPGIIVLLALVLAARPLLSRRSRLVLLAAAGLWLVWIGSGVRGQLPKWRDSEALFGHLAATIDSKDGRDAYAGSLAIHRARRGDFVSARAYLDESEKAGADSFGVESRRKMIASLESLVRAPVAIPGARGHMVPDAIAAYILARQAMVASEERTALRRFRQALDVDPDFHDARHDLVVILALLHRREEARAELSELRARAGPALPPAVAARLESLVNGGEI